VTAVQTSEPSRRIDRPRLFAGLRRLAGRLSQAQVDAGSALLDAMERDPRLTDERHAAYLLATAWHETAGTLEPIAERGGLSYIRAQYDPVHGDTPRKRARAQAMGNTSAGDGWRYRGRGYVQLTWANNYRRAGEALGLDLVDDPDLALEPAVAYRILAIGMAEGWFTGRRLGAYIAGPKCDYLGARRVVNGTDRAAEIAGHARVFESALSMT
jgi:predicted chitinase